MSVTDRLRRAAIVHAETPRQPGSGRPAASPLYDLIPVGAYPLPPGILDAIEEITGTPVPFPGGNFVDARARAHLNRWAVRTHPLVLESRRRDTETLRAMALTREAAR